MVVALRAIRPPMREPNRVPAFSEPHSRRMCLARLHHGGVFQAAAELQQCSKGSSRWADGVELDAQLSRRRALLAAAATLAFSSSCPGRPARAAAVEDSDFVNPKLGFRLSIPPAWELKSKAGADALWEDPQRRSTSIGVTVSPVRVRSIEDFGGLDVVGTRLLEAERKKDSTLSVAMVSQASRRQADSGALLFDYEYELNSTRGRKRILNTVTIYGGKLFILNASYKCDKQADATGTDAAAPVACSVPQDVLGTLRGTAASFTVLPAAKQ